MRKTVTAYISAGSNLGDRKSNLEFALKSLAGAGTLTKVSSFYETEPVGFLDQPWFLNQAIELKTRLSAVELLSFCREIEAARGRVRTYPDAPRTLDLDILLFGEEVINEPDLIVPHPRLPERKFVLQPLVQIAPDTTHPILKKSMQYLLEACPDQSAVRIVEPDPPETSKSGKLSRNGS